MSKIVQWKRGNTSVNSTYVGAAGEITIDTEIWTAYVHDGVTTGGHAFSAGAMGNLTISGVNGQTITGTVANANIVFAPNGSGVLRSNSGITSVGAITGPNITVTGFANVGGVLNVTGDTVITGNLRVNGVTETINSTTVTINDKNIVLGNNVSTSANVDGGGIDLGSPTVAHWRYTDTSRGWVTGNNIAAGGNITAAGYATVNFLTVNNSLTVQSTITTAANLTAAAMAVNNSATIGTTLGVTGNLNVGNVITTGTVYGNAAAAATGTISNAVGYMGMPQNSQSVNYTLALIDQGKHIYLTANSNITIPANSSVSFPIGATISVVNGPNVQSNVIITTDTLYLAANGATGTRSISTYGMFTLVKVTNTVWYINGLGIT